MIDRMTTVMAERMAGRMSPDQMQAMMAEMMGQLFAGMEPADRIAFMQAMIGTCIPKITEGLTPTERGELAARVLDRIAEELKQAVRAPQP